MKGIETTSTAAHEILGRPVECVGDALEICEMFKARVLKIDGLLWTPNDCKPVDVTEWVRIRIGEYTRPVPMLHPDWAKGLANNVLDQNGVDKICEVFGFNWFDFKGKIYVGTKRQSLNPL